jgi:hypothetical protein
MGRQYNKVENRKRRNSYIKRKKTAIKAKRTAAKPAAPATA